MNTKRDTLRQVDEYLAKLKIERMALTDRALKDMQEAECMAMRAQPVSVPKLYGAGYHYGLDRDDVEILKEWGII